MPAKSWSARRERQYQQLYEDARAEGIAGRSKMSKAQLERALGR